MKLLIFILVFPTWVFAQSYRLNNDSPPILELGVGAVYGTAPHYPGSDETNRVFVPFPAIIYRGEVLRSDEDGGLRTRFFNSDNAEVNISFGGALPASSEDNDDREGMPSLDTMIEFGPGFIYHFMGKKTSSRWRLSINVPVRLAVSTDFSDTRERGLVFNPVLFSFYEITDRLTLFNAVSGRWVTRKFNDYLYTVEDKFVNSTREAYRADSGNVLFAYSAALIYNQGTDYSFFTGLSYENYKAAANKASPLFIRPDNISTVVGITWWFYEKQSIAKK